MNEFDVIIKFCIFDTHIVFEENFFGSYKLTLQTSAARENQVDKIYVPYNTW